MFVSAAVAAPQKTHNLPVLFQFSQPGHNVAVFRGADLKKAIASGLVSGFGSLGGSGADGRDGRSEENGDGTSDDNFAGSSYTTTAAPPPTTAAPPPTTTDLPPITTTAYVAPVTDAPVTDAPVTDTPATDAPVTDAPLYTQAPTVYRPAPLVYRPAPIVYKPAPAPFVYKPAPAHVVYNPAPAPVVYKQAPSYAEPSYADIPAKYVWEYAVKDDYTNNNFGAKESRDGTLTNGKYYVALPDGRLQTVTYVVDGDAGYVPVVEYSGEAQYPAAAPYSA